MAEMVVMMTMETKVGRSNSIFWKYLAVFILVVFACKTDRLFASNGNRNLVNNSRQFYVFHNAIMPSINAVGLGSGVTLASWDFGNLGIDVSRYQVGSYFVQDIRIDQTNITEPNNFSAEVIGDINKLGLVFIVSEESKLGYRHTALLELTQFQGYGEFNIEFDQANTLINANIQTVVARFWVGPTFPLKLANNLDFNIQLLYGTSLLHQQHNAENVEITGEDLSVEEIEAYSEKALNDLGWKISDSYIRISFGIFF